VIEALRAQGRFGRKTGAGWYAYEENRTARADPEVEALIERAARESGTTRRSIPAEEIVQRTIYALINEGARILEEGYSLRASDIDLVYINGHGFPAYRGGPMRYADETGLQVVYNRILEFRAEHGANWEPSPLLARLAASGVRFRTGNVSAQTLTAAEDAHDGHAENQFVPLVHGLDARTHNASIRFGAGNARFQNRDAYPHCVARPKRYRPANFVDAG